MHGNNIARIVIVLAALGAAACAPLTQRAGIPVAQRPSPNFDARRASFVILHFTASDDAERALRTLTSAVSRVSSHYLITRDGRIHYLVDEYMRAWHAGVSYWGGNHDLNSASIGIELDNDGGEPFAKPQIESLLVLLADLRERYAIPAANYLGHSDIAPRRKVDPGPYFPWQRLAAHGFGLWCDPPYAAAPHGVDDGILLAALGYDVSDIAAAVGAFKVHFVPGGDSRHLTEEDRALAYCLLGKRRD